MKLFLSTLLLLARASTLEVAAPPSDDDIVLCRNAVQHPVNGIKAHIHSTIFNSIPEFGAAPVYNPGLYQPMNPPFKAATGGAAEPKKGLSFAWCTGDEYKSIWPAAVGGTHAGKGHGRAIDTNRMVVEGLGVKAKTTPLTFGAAQAVAPGVPIPTACRKVGTSPINKGISNTYLIQYTKADGTDFAVRSQKHLRHGVVGYKSSTDAEVATAKAQAQGLINYMIGGGKHPGFVSMDLQTATLGWTGKTDTKQVLKQQKLLATLDEEDEDEGSGEGKSSGIEDTDDEGSDDDEEAPVQAAQAEALPTEMAVYNYAVNWGGQQYTSGTVQRKNKEMGMLPTVRLAIKHLATFSRAIANAGPDPVPEEQFNWAAVGGVCVDTNGKWARAGNKVKRFLRMTSKTKTADKSPLVAAKITAGAPEAISVALDTVSAELDTSDTKDNVHAKMLCALKIMKLMAQQLEAKTNVAPPFPIVPLLYSPGNNAGEQITNFHRGLMFLTDLVASKSGTNHKVQDLVNVLATSAYLGLDQWVNCKSGQDRTAIMSAANTAINMMVLSTTIARDQGGLGKECAVRVFETLREYQDTRLERGIQAYAMSVANQLTALPVCNGKAAGQVKVQLTAILKNLALQSIVKVGHSVTGASTGIVGLKWSKSYYGVADTDAKAADAKLKNSFGPATFLPTFFKDTTNTQVTAHYKQLKKAEKKAGTGPTSAYFFDGASNRAS